MVLNLGKSHYMITNRDISNGSIEFGKKTLHVEAEQKLFGIIIDKDLNFQSRKKLIIKPANQKLSALKANSIIVPYSGCLALEL